MKTKAPKNTLQSSNIDDDIAKAADENAGLPPISDDSEKPAGLPDGMTWGEPPTDSGREVPRVPLEDEESAAEQLIRGGVEVAQSQRKPMPPQL